MTDASAMLDITDDGIELTVFSDDTTVDSVSYTWDDLVTDTSTESTDIATAIETMTLHCGDTKPHESIEDDLYASLSNESYR